MTSDQSPQHAMTPESYERVVIRIAVPVILVVRSPTIVEISFHCSPPTRSESTEISWGHHHAEIPKLHALFLTVTEDIS
jgi:hypothetical protein